MYMYVCYSPSRTSIEPLNASFTDKLEDSDFGGDLKLRSNGSRRLAQAVPNPYSNSEFLLYALLQYLNIGTLSARIWSN